MRKIINKIVEFYQWHIIDRYYRFMYYRFINKCKNSKVFNFRLTGSSFWIESREGEEGIHSHSYKLITLKNNIITVISYEYHNGDYRRYPLPNTKTKYYPNSIDVVNFR